MAKRPRDDDAMGLKGRTEGSRGLRLTQERLHILLRRWPDMAFDMIFVDERRS